MTYTCRRCKKTFDGEPKLTEITHWNTEPKVMTGHFCHDCAMKKWEYEELGYELEQEMENEEKEG